MQNDDAFHDVLNNNAYMVIIARIESTTASEPVLVDE
jgi:hypothetical protein